MTAELVLLFMLYVAFILGIFLSPRYGLLSSFGDTLPYLSARIEKHVATGHGFWKPGQSNSVDWQKPPVAPQE